MLLKVRTIEPISLTILPLNQQTGYATTRHNYSQSTILQRLQKHFFLKREIYIYTYIQDKQKVLF